MNWSLACVCILVWLHIRDHHFALRPPYANWSFMWLFNSRSFFHGFAKSTSLASSQVPLYGASERDLLVRIISLQIRVWSFSIIVARILIHLFGISVGLRWKGPRVLCWKGENLTFEAIEVEKVLEQITVDIVFRASLEAKLVEILRYFQRYLGLVEIEEKNFSYFSWSNSMTIDSTIVPIETLSDWATAMSLEIIGLPSKVVNLVFAMKFEFYWTLMKKLQQEQLLFAKYEECDSSFFKSRVLL